jgi:hypothetical protein
MVPHHKPFTPGAPVQAIEEFSFSGSSKLQSHILAEIRGQKNLSQLATRDYLAAVDLIFRQPKNLTNS